MTFADDDEDPRLIEAHERRIGRCREQSCRKQIIWLKNPKTGKSVPVDADTVAVTDQEFDSERHVSHFKTCTAPNRFSKGAA